MKVDATFTRRAAFASFKPQEVAKSPGTRTIDSSASVQATLSPGAQIASTLFDAANAYVQAEHMKPFAGYDRGTVNANAYINVERYNNYVFDQAATRMVDDAARSGLTLDKADILTALKTSNDNIASLKSDPADRADKLGPASLLSELSTSDLNSMTDLYIAAKRNGLDTGQIESVAVEVGMANRDKRLGIVTVVYDPQKELTGYWSTSPSVAVSTSSSDTYNQAKVRLYGKFGLPVTMVNLLVDAVKAGNKDSAQTLAFLQALASSNNQPPH